MKNVFLILVVMGGFAVVDAVAQSCNPANCLPCPPGCCIINCCTPKAAAVSASSAQPVEVMFASLLAENLQGEVKAGNISRKEMKACLAACKASSATVVTNCMPTPACQAPVACKAENSIAVQGPVTVQASLQKN